MDTSKVYMVRSAKGNDMLCVDSFLYHYEDRSTNTYRWVCSRRKDKMLPCRSRLTTALVDRNDESKHCVIKVCGDHTHGQCSAEEIFKVYERKRIANLAGEPCTLENKTLKRKLKRIEEFEQTNAEGNNSLCKTDHEENKQQSNNTSSLSAVPKTAFKFEANQIYELKTVQGHQMICFEGHLYRLNGKSQKSEIYRWQCIRNRDINCLTNIYTERLPNGEHKLKQTRREQHTHEAYTQGKLKKLFEKNKMTVVNGNGTKSLVFDTQNTKTLDSSKKSELDDNIENEKSSQKKEMKKTESKKTRARAMPCTYTLAGDPLAGVKSEKLSGDSFKFTFLPSAKGRKVLCLNNFIYHLDTSSPRNGRSYWTCLMRRTKKTNCKARVTMQETEDGPIVVKVTGSHSHADSADEIKKRMYKGVVATKANKTKMKPSEIIESSLNELGNDFKEIVAKSKENIERRIGRLRMKQKKNISNRRNDDSLDMDANDSNSSFSSALASDDDHFNNSELPNKIEDMYEKLPKTKEDNSFYTNVETIWEIAPNVKEVDSSMHEEYLETAFDDNNEESNIREDSEESDFDYKPAIQKRRLPRTIYKKVINDTNMDITKVSKLRSAKGGDLLCVDGYIYHVKSQQNIRTYWTCIKRKDVNLNCRSRVSTIINREGNIEIFKVTNCHTHPVFEEDIKRRLCNELAKERSSADATVKPRELMHQNLSDLSEKYAKLVADSLGSRERLSRITLDAKKNDAIMKLYAVSDGPPSLAVRMTLKALEIPYELIFVNYGASEHLSENYAKMNPQKEIPVLDDNGYYLSESVAIMQYLCDKYSPQSTLYPKDAIERSVVNHRLCFNMGFYYASISMHVMAPIFFDYKRTDMSLKKVTNALAVFETYLKRVGTKYATSDNVTIADFALVSATLCLEAIGFDLSPYPLVKKWYETFKLEQPELWKIGNGGMQEITEFDRNPPDLSHMKHPFHPTKKS